MHRATNPSVRLLNDGVCPPEVNMARDLALFEAFEKLKQKLAAEGLFDPVHKRPLPRLPQAVGVVTSLQAAALRDVITALQRRAPYVSVVVYPVAVQGAGAQQRASRSLASCVTHHTSRAGSWLADVGPIFIRSQIARSCSTVTGVGR